MLHRGFGLHNAKTSSITLACLGSARTITPMSSHFGSIPKRDKNLLCFLIIWLSPGCQALKLAGEQSPITDKQCLNPSKTQSAGRRSCPTCHFKKGHVTHSRKSGCLKLGLIELRGKTFLVPYESKLFRRMIISDLRQLYGPHTGKFLWVQGSRYKNTPHKATSRRQIYNKKPKQANLVIPKVRPVFQRLMAPRKSWMRPKPKTSYRLWFVVVVAFFFFKVLIQTNSFASSPLMCKYTVLTAPTLAAV